MQCTGISGDAGENLWKHEEVHDHETQEVVSIVVEREE